MKARADHFMPAALLDSQIETLEPPTADENAVRLAVEGTPETILAKAMAELAPRLAQG
jgi:gluconokinase